MEPIVAVNSPLARRAVDEQQEQALATLLVVTVVVAILCDPGVLLGMVAAQLIWVTTRADHPYRWNAAVLLAGAAFAMHSSIAVAWPWRAMLPAALAHSTGLTPVADGTAMRSFAVEALAGPLVLQLALTARALRRRVLRERLQEDELRVIASRGPRNMGLFAELIRKPLGLADTTDHPPSGIRLGVDMSTEKQFDVTEAELAQHVFLPGTTNTGKTTTIARIADGVLQLGWAVVIVDCKGGDLRETGATLAAAHHVPFVSVDPDDENTIGYDVCVGDAAAVANKLLGAFSYEGAAEVYKHAAMELIPVVVRALRAAGDPVTLEALYTALDRGGLAQLGRRAGEPHRSRLASLEQSGQVGSSAYSGLQRRLGALLEGRFGPLLRSEHALDWQQQLARPSVTYLALSATASSEDVELMGRVIAQDLKQVAGGRFRPDAHRVPALIVFDEFAALREAEQIVDLLLQARQARFSVVVSTQFLPESVPVLKACLGSGLLIAHRLESDDAEALASQFGTRTAFEPTLQYDKETGYSEKGSVRQVEQYHLHPNELREMPQGHAAVRSVLTHRRCIVRIHRP